MKMNEKSYIVVPNVAFAFGSEYHLNKDEFMVYAHLQFMKQVGLDNVTVTTVEMLVAGLGWETSKKSRDKANMAKILQSLEEKRYIKIDCDGEITKSILKIHHNQDLKEAVVETTVDWKNKPFVFKGYTQITGKEYNLAENNGYHMMVISYIKWRINAQFQYSISFKEWEAVLGVSDKTARTIIDKCESFINKISGDFYIDANGKVKQETNTYELITRKQETSVKSNLNRINQEVRNLTELEKKREECIDDYIVSNNDIFMQIFDMRTRIQFEGYKAWRETTCKVAKEAGQIKINKIKASPKNNYAGKKAIERLEKQYQEYLEERRKYNEMTEIMMENFIADYSEYVPPRKNKGTKVEFDISDFIDD